MARGVQLGQLVQELRGELGDSLRVSVGVDHEDALKVVLRRVQEQLYDEYDWDHMRVFASKALAAGQRYYDLPTELKDAQVEQVAIKWSSDPYSIERGIGFEQYAAYDSDADERADPVQAWDLRRTSASATQVEVWPIPVSNSQVLWFKGKRNLRPLVAESDVTDLDNILIVLTAAGELLARRKSEDAPAKQAAAGRRLLTLRGKGSSAREPIVIGGGEPLPRRTGPIIRVS